MGMTHIVSKVNTLVTNCTLSHHCTSLGLFEPRRLTTSVILSEVLPICKQKFYIFAEMSTNFIQIVSENAGGRFLHTKNSNKDIRSKTVPAFSHLRKKTGFPYRYAAVFFAISHSRNGLQQKRTGWDRKASLNSPVDMARIIRLIPHPGHSI